MLSKSKFRELFSNLNAPVKKVYEAVPNGEAWDATKIMSELRRLNISMRDPKAIIGCLDTLRQRGLITEPSRGNFVRVPIRDNEAIHSIIEEVKKEDVVNTNTKNNTTLKKTTIEKLTDLSSKATGLAAQMKLLASDLELVAIELEDEIHDSSEAARKFTQLQQLLKGLT
jgi:hypothetical protein